MHSLQARLLQAHFIAKRFVLAWMAEAEHCNIFVERLWRSLKHEDIYLKGYAHMAELALGLTDYFTFYNGERPHQSLSDQVPNEVYRTGKGGGAKIVDKFKSKNSGDEIPMETGKFRVTMCRETEKLKLR